ncbi:MAG: tryptophan synthase subunit alpha [Chloroflexi bacterium]|nr:tryptophan synthase subunit alpha [Chloroflexota bacterium]
MSRISSVFRPGHKALIAYLTVGYPDVETTVKAASILAESGCDLIELGVPFSDPVADGVTIQKASQRALEQGVTPKVCLEVATRISQRTSLPLVFMSYYNPILSFGLKQFCQASARAGVNGLIIPDLPPDEGAELESVTGQCDLDLIYLLAPTSTEERIKLVAERSRGFIYLVSLTGVTGARQSLPMELEEFVERVRKATKQPLCVGFGISTGEQARRIGEIADGVIIGSRIIQLLEEDSTLHSLKTFTATMRKALG